MARGWEAGRASDDEDPLADRAGSLEGLLLLHGTRPEESDDAFQTGLARREDALVRWFRDNDDSDAALFDDGDLVFYIDALVARMSQRPGEDHVRIYTFARDLVREAQRPSPLKLALSLMGAFGHVRDIPIFLTLARHPELSVYALGALFNTVPESRARARLLIPLLPYVSSWARLHLIVHLLACPLDKRQTATVLRHGLQRLHGLEIYIAQHTAEALDIAEIVRQASGRDPDLVRSVGELLQILASIETTEEGEFISPLAGHLETIAAYLDTIADAPATLHGYAVVRSLLGSLSAANEPASDPGTKTGMEKETEAETPRREEIQLRAAEYIDSNRWPPLIQAALALGVRADEDEDVEVAILAADDHELDDLNDLLLARLARFPHEAVTTHVLLLRLDEAELADVFPILYDRLELASHVTPGAASPSEAQRESLRALLDVFAVSHKVIGGPLALPFITDLVAHGDEETARDALSVLSAWAERDAVRVREAAASAVVTTAQTAHDPELRARASDTAARLGLPLPDDGSSPS